MVTASTNILSSKTDRRDADDDCEIPETNACKVTTQMTEREMVR